MWRLEHISALWWWLVIPLALLALFWLTRKNMQRLNAIGNPERIKALIREGDESQIRVKRGVWIAAITLIILAMANLQSGTEEESVTNKGSNVVIALDLSNSMLAKDIAPDRLERSKKFLTSLVNKFSGDRVAFIVFAGRAYIQMPFTTDYGAFEMQLRSVHTDMIPTQGTALGEAIQLAASMQGSAAQQEKVLILLSDGEDHDSKAISMAKDAAANRTIVHTIGVGTNKGAPIPEHSKAGGIAYKKDLSGKQVLTRLNEDILKDIAAAGGGKYFNISDEKRALKEISRSIKWSAGSAGEERAFTRYKSYFQWFLFPAIFLLMLDLAGIHVLIRRKNISTASVILPLLFFSLLVSCQSKPEKALQKAYTCIEKGDLEAGFAQYHQIAGSDSSALAQYNLGATYLLMNQQDSALVYFERALSSQPDTVVAMQSQYNKGYIQYQKKDYKAAAEAFKQALRLVPGNYRAQYNLCMALEHLPPQENPPQQDQDQQKDQDKEENQDQKDQDQQNNQGEPKNDKDSKNQSGDQDKKDKNDQPKEPKQEQGKEPDKGQSSPQQGTMSAQDLQRLYQALDQQEKAVKKRIMTQQGDKTGKPYVEKDW